MSELISSPPASGTAPQRSFDLVFFIRGFPEKLSLYDESVFATVVHPAVIPTLATSTEGLHGGDFFNGADRLACFGIRLGAPSTKEAISAGRYVVDAMIDGLSLAIPRPLPKVGFLVIVCDDTQEHGQWVHFSPIAWLKMSQSKSAPHDGPSPRERSILELVSPFMDVIAESHPHHDSDLAHQLVQSLKMYRHGAEANSFAVEFICKFSALEGLVCGEKELKGPSLRDRLPRLFRNDEIVTAARIQRLWEDRNAAIHASAGFYSVHAKGTRAVQTHLSEVDYLFRGVVAFAIGRLKEARTVPELWAAGDTFDLPGWALDRKGDAFQLAVHDQFTETGVTLPWARGWFAANLEEARRQREAP